MSKIDKLKREQERMKLLQAMADKDNHRTNLFQFLGCVFKNGLGVLIAIGSWGGIYAVSNGGGYRIGLGWLAISILPFDGDVLLELATRSFVKEFTRSGMLKSAKDHIVQPVDTDSLIGDLGPMNQEVDPASAEKINALLDEFFNKQKGKHD